MDRKRLQRGIVSLSVLMVFLVVAALLIASTVGRNLFLASDIHRDLFEKQAEYLVQSARERAIQQIGSVEDPLQIEPQQYQEPIAPVYVISDPLIDDATDADHRRQVTAEYGFRIDAINTDTPEPGITKSCLIRARCVVPYRDTSITKMETYRCTFSPEKGWKSVPVIPSNES